jgi:hypothetical protein
MAGVSGFNLSWAGNRMNVDFLTRQALKKSMTLKKWDSQMIAELYGTSSLVDRSLLMADIVTDGLWGSSIGISDFKTNLVTGATASALGLISSTASGLQDRRGKKKMRKLLETVKNYNTALENNIKTLYEELQSGSPEARAKLVEMTCEDDVEEIELNIAMESYFKARKEQPQLILKAEPLSPQITQKTDSQ